MLIVTNFLMSFPAHQSYHRPLLLLISLCLIRSLLQERQLSHHFHSITPRHSRGTTSSLFFNRFYHIEDNVQLGWGESWGRKFLLLMLSYFGNLVAFCLILKFSFYHPWLLRKNFQIKMGEIEFLSFHLT